MPEAEGLDRATTQALVRDGYDRIASQYLELVTSADQGHARRRQAGDFLDALPASSDVLDLGCGPGLPIGRMAAEAGHRYTGLDLSPRQIELARANVPDATFLAEDVLDAAFDPSTFAGILMLYAITHVPRDEWHAVFARVAHWLRSPGLFLVNVPAHDDPGWLEEDFLGTTEKNWTNAYGPRVTTELLGAANLVIVRSHLHPDDVDGGPGWHWITARKA